MKHVRRCSMVCLTMITVACLVSVADGSDTPDTDVFIKPGQKVVFLGDSITYAGHYIAYIDAVMYVQSGTDHPKLLNLGLPSETVSGLSEPDHPFPRPDVHERLARVLDRTKLDVVVACYGMNDGIYYPFDQKRFAAYQQGINKLINAVAAARAKLVLLTPPPFDPLPMRKDGKLRPAGAEKYAWFAIYEDYDQVIARYAAWMLQQRDRVDMVVNINQPIVDYMAKKRKSDADFTMSGDGVHLNDEGHHQIALALLDALGYSTDKLPDGELLELVGRRQNLLRDAWLTHVGHKRPGMKAGLPLPQATAKAAELEKEILKRVGSLSP